MRSKMPLSAHAHQSNELADSNTSKEATEGVGVSALMPRTRQIVIGTGQRVENGPSKNTALFLSSLLPTAVYVDDHHNNCDDSQK